jgi:hypothetical protein
MLKIRDFAAGLTPDQVERIYAKYGKSTKRDADDAMANNYNGQIGIGAKSGMCYGTKQFSVTSYVAGEMTVYNCYVDEDGDPTYAKLFTAESDEPSGLEISIPVEARDLNRFHQEAVRVYSYFDPMPEIQNLNDNCKIARPEPKSGLEGKGWRLTGSTSYAIMGNVAYPIDLSQIDDANDATRTLVSSGVEIDFPIGDLSIAISREALKYTPRTKRILNERLQVVVDELADNVTDKFTTAANIWEAKILYRKVFNELGQLGTKLSRMLTGKVVWNGIPIDNDSFKWNDSSDAVIMTGFTKSYRKKSLLASGRTKVIQARPDNIVIINDLNTGKGSPSRISELYKNEPFNEAVVLTFADKAAEAKFNADLNFNSVPVKFLSALDKPAVVRAAANAKHQLKCFKWDANKVSHGINSEAWTPEVIDFENGSGVYVKIERFEAQSPTGRGYSPYYLKTMLQQATDAGIIINDLYAIKPAMLEKKTLGAGWVELWDFIKNEITKKVSSNNLLQNIIDQHELDKNEKNEYKNFFPKVGDIKDNNSPLKLYIKAVEDLRLKSKTISTANIDKIIKVYNAFNYQFDNTLIPTYNLTEMRKNITVKYPLTGLISVWSMEANAEKIIEYVNLIDANP